MMKQHSRRCIAILATASSAGLIGLPVLARTTSFVDLDAGAGYSTNADLSTADDTGSLFGRIAANAVHLWESERTSVGLSAYGENSTYARRHGSDQLFAVNGRVNHAVSETVRLWSHVGFAADISGQLANRFVTPTLLTDGSVTPTVQIGAPAVPALDSTLPLSPGLSIGDPDFLAITGRHYRAVGDLGASISPSTRDTFTFTSSVQKSFYGGSRDEFNQISYGGSAAYSRQLSERASVGASLGARQTDLRGPDNGATIITPQLTGQLLLASDWQVSGSVGVSFASLDTPTGKDRSTDLALEGSICNSREHSQFCARAMRYTRSELTSDLVTTTTVQADYYRRLDDKQSITLAASVLRYNGLGVFNLTGLDVPDTVYLTAGGTYRRELSQRLSAGLSLNARKIEQDGSGSPSDVSGSVFVRYRLGDVR